VVGVVTIATTLAAPQVVWREANSAVTGEALLDLTATGEKLLGERLKVLHGSS
jgi:hypothetical protein